MTDWNNWGKKFISKGGGGPPREPGEHSPPGRAPGGPPAAAPLPPPPPGYGWAWHPQYGYMAVPLQQAAPAPPPAPAAYYPPPSQARPAQPQAPARVLPFQRPQTCQLVRPGNRDTYAELLETIPDLVAPQQFDGPSPETLAELAHLPEFHDVGPGADPHTPTAGFPTSGRGTPGNTTRELKVG